MMFMHLLILPLICPTIYMIPQHSLGASARPSPGWSPRDIGTKTVHSPPGHPPPLLTGSQRMSPFQAVSPQSGTKQLRPLAHVSSLKFLFEELGSQVRTETRFRQAKGSAQPRAEVPLPPVLPPSSAQRDWLTSSH